MMRSSLTFPRIAALAATTAVVLGAGLLTAPAANAAGTTFYVDNRTGSNCSDTGAGTSADAPWCTFAPASDLTLGAGESLLLARGASWSEQLTVDLQGSASQPATIGAYGSGDAPRILSNPSGIGVDLTNPNHAEITGLDIGAKKADGTGALAFGIMATYDTLGNEDLTFSDLTVRDSWQIGIMVRSTKPSISVDDTALTGLAFENIYTTGNAQGIANTAQGGFSDQPTSPEPGNHGSKVFRDVLVDGYYSYHDDANEELDRVSAFGVPCVSLTLQASTDVVVRNSILDTGGACRTTVGTTALFLGLLENVLLANNMIINTPNTMNPDMVGIDHESLTKDVTLAGNYFADNYGGAVEYLGIHGANDYSVGNLATGNVFVSNGYHTAIPNGAQGSLSQVGGGIVVEAEVSDNIYAEPYGLLSAHGGGSTESFTTSNNVSIDDPELISQSAAQFGTAGWGYQSGSAGHWSALGIDGASDAYTGSGVAIDRFTLTPSASTAAALTWTAPSDGVVSLRGYPVADAGTVHAVVTKNDAEIAAADADADGAAIVLDDLTVKSGDVIRFVVPAGAGTVSWAPSVSYTSKAVGTDPDGLWTFSVAGDAQGWTSSASTEVTRGAATLTSSTATTAFDSADGLNLSTADHTALSLSYSNPTAATAGRVYFTTEAGQDFTEARSVPFSIDAHVDQGIVEGYHSVIVPLDGNAAFTGSIQRIRVEVSDAAGTFAIDSIELSKPAASGWEFSTAAGWTATADASCSDPGMPSANPVVDVDNSAGSFAQYADIIWNVGRMQQFTVSTPNLAQIDFWAYKTGSTKGCLFFRVIEITDDATHTGDLLFTGAVPASAVSTTGGFVSIYPGLTGLDTDATYGLQIFSPYAIPGTGTYGVAYSDDPAKPASGFGELYSPDSRGTWYGPETNRSLKFTTYSAATIADRVDAGYGTAPIVDGAIHATAGYEPAAKSPTGLGITAEDTRYIHIRMSNPDNRSTAYLLFTTEEDPTYDAPGDGWPVPNEKGGKGVAFSLVEGAEYHEYVLDMSVVAGWKGTIDQIMLEPATRWSYRIGDLNSTWSGKIDYIRFAPEQAAQLEAPVVDTERPTTTLVTPTTAGPFSQLAIQLDAADNVGLKRIVANIYQGTTLVKSTQTAVANGAKTGSHTATVTLPDGAYTIKYNAEDLAGNIAKTVSFPVTIDATKPTATVKDGASFTTATGATYDQVSFKLYDAGKVSKVEINGVVKDLTDNTWSDVNYIKPGVFGAVKGANTLVVYDVAGNTQTVEFTLN